MWNLVHKNKLLIKSHINITPKFPKITILYHNFKKLIQNSIKLPILTTFKKPNYYSMMTEIFFTVLNIVEWREISTSIERVYSFFLYHVTAFHYMHIYRTTISKRQKKLQLFIYSCHTRRRSHYNSVILRKYSFCAENQKRQQQTALPTHNLTNISISIFFFSPLSLPQIIVVDWDRFDKI